MKEAQDDWKLTRKVAELYDNPYIQGFVRELDRLIEKNETAEEETLP